FRGDIAAGARLVLDHHLLAPHFGEPRAEDAADPVDAAAGRERHDEFHEAVGPAWQRRRLRGRGAAEGEDGRRRDQGEEAAAIDDDCCRGRFHWSTWIFASRAAAERTSLPDVSTVVAKSPAKPRRVSISSRPPSPSRPLRREGARAHPRVSLLRERLLPSVRSDNPQPRSAPPRDALHPSMGCCRRAFSYFPFPPALGGT